MISFVTIVAPSKVNPLVHDMVVIKADTWLASKVSLSKPTPIWASTKDTRDRMLATKTSCGPSVMAGRGVLCEPHQAARDLGRCVCL